MLLNSGCLLLVAGGAVAGTAFALGKLESLVDGNLKKVDTATSKALQEMKFTKVKHAITDIDALHTYKGPKDQNIFIELEKLTDKTTKVFIKVGTFGDEKMSVTILESIKENL